MKTFRYISFLALSLCLLGTFSSCKDDDFLEEHPKTFYAPENAFETMDQVNAAITTLYRHTRRVVQIDKFLLGLGSDVMDQPYFRSTGKGYGDFASWSSTSNNAETPFNRLYQIANYANFALEGINSEKVAMSSEERAALAAEAKFFRGFAYLTLGELFGGVPLVDKFYEELKLDFERATREATYEFAIKDLKDAAENLPDYPKVAGKVAKGAAFHYLAEAYISLATVKGNDKADLTQAINYATQAIDMHPLMTKRFGTRADATSKDVRNKVPAYYPDGDVFFDLFQEGNFDYSEGNTEAVWTLQNDYEVYKKYSGDNYVDWPRNFSSVARDVRWNSEYATEKSTAPWSTNIDPELYPGTNVCAYVGGRGIASYAPTTYVINTVWDGDYFNDMRNSPCNIRRNFICLDTLHYMYGKPVTIEMLEHDNQRITEFFPCWTKMAPIDDWGYDDLEDGGNRSNMYCDRYMVRSAATILLRAEAKFRSGDAGGAADDINMLRNRAKCTTLAKASDITIQYILDERVRELWGEELRWCTLLRMGQDGINSLNAHQMYIEPQTYWFEFFKPSHDKVTDWTLFPIPQKVIDGNSDAKIEQNPGW